jgi:hypothetical protein
MHRLPVAKATLVSDTAAVVVVGVTPKRGESSLNTAVSSGSQP